MTNFTKLSTLVFGTALLTLSACSTATSSRPAKTQKSDMQAKHQMMDGEHKGMMAQMKMDHDMMMKMDMSKMDMSKLSDECKTMITKMKSKMVDKHKDGGMQPKMKSGMKDHDMSKMENHDMSMMKEHNPEKMQAMMTKHKKCMAEMKEAMPRDH